MAAIERRQHGQEDGRQRRPCQDVTQQPASVNKDGGVEVEDGHVRWQGNERWREAKEARRENQIVHRTGRGMTVEAAITPTMINPLTGVVAVSLLSNANASREVVVYNEGNGSADTQKCQLWHHGVVMP